MPVDNVTGSYASHIDVNGRSSAQEPPSPEMKVATATADFFADASKSQARKLVMELCQPYADVTPNRTVKKFAALLDLVTADYKNCVYMPAKNTFLITDSQQNKIVEIAIKHDDYMVKMDWNAQNDKAEAVRIYPCNRDRKK